MISKEQFSQFILHLKTAIPHGSSAVEDPEAVKIWYQAFQEVDLDALRKAYAYCRDNEKFFPSIARLKEIIGKTRPSFDELVRLIKLHGAYRPPELEPLVVRTINRMGGWQAVCEWKDSDLPFRRKDFEKIVEDLVAMETMGAFAGQTPPALTGSHEITPSRQPERRMITAAKEPIPASTIDWEPIKKAHGTDLDLCVSAKLLAKGFFKLHSRPKSFFSYRGVLTPGKHDPYAFVDIDDHMAEIRAKIPGGGAVNYDPNSFNSERYSVDRMS